MKSKHLEFTVIWGKKLSRKKKKKHFRWEGENPFRIAFFEALLRLPGYISVFPMG